MKTLLRVIGIAAIILALAAGGFWLYRSRAATPAGQGTAGAAATGDTFTQLVAAQRGDLNSAITVVGELAAVQSADLVFEEMSGTAPLVTLEVAAGNTVKAGQVLATIDPAAYQQALDQARSDLQAAEQKLADLQEPVTELAIAQADLAIAVAEQSLAQAKQDLVDLRTQDLTDLRNAVRTAQDDIAVAQLQQTLAEHGSLAKSERDLQYAAGWHQRRIADLAKLVAENKANLEQKQEITTEQEKLAEIQADLAQVSSEQQLALQSAAAQVVTARTALAQAQQNLADAQGGGDELDVAKAQLAIKEAEVSLAAAQDARTQLDEGPDATEVTAAQADVDKKRLAVQDAEKALAGARLTAPFDGTILQTNVNAGDSIAANTQILTLANLQQLQVLASVDETTIRRVAAGQPAQITFDALPGQTLTGQVGEVPLQGSLQGGVMVYEVPISVEGARNLPLLTGMTANVQIQTGQAANALLIPSMALQKVSGMYQVLVADPANPAAEPQSRAGRGRAERRRLHPDRARPQRRRPGRRPDDQRREQQLLQGLRRWVHHAGGWQRAAPGRGAMSGAANMKRVFGTLILVLIIAALGYGGYRFYQSRQATATAASGTASDTFTQLVAAQRGDLNSAITVVGELAAEQSADLVFEEMSGTAPLVTLEVAAGNTVKAGQVLATIDPAAYQQALDQARSDLQAAEQKLADLQEPVTELAIAQADLAIAKAEYQVKQAQNALDELLNPDLDELQQNVADAQTSLTQARASLVSAQTDTAAKDQLEKLRDTEAELTVEHGRLASETYSDTFYQDRLQVAYNKMMSAQDTRVTTEVQAQLDLLKAQMQVRQAEQKLADAQEALAEAKAGSDALTLAKARLDVREAEVSLAAAQDARTQLDEGPDATEVTAAQADVDKKRLAVQDAEKALAGAKLTAPFDGTILQTNVNAGDSIAANTQILTLANLQQLQVLASVDETTIRRVAAGQPAQITFDALPGQTLTGQVGEVPLQGSLQGGVMVYEVPISVEGARNLPLLTGMTANVQIQTGQAANALLIPSMALQKVSGMYQVLVADPANPAAEPQAVPVEVGLSDGAYTQIVRGLNDGDQVVVRMTSADSNNFFGGFGMMGGGPPPGGAEPNRQRPNSNDR